MKKMLISWRSLRRLSAASSLVVLVSCQPDTAKEADTAQPREVEPKATDLPKAVSNASKAKDDKGDAPKAHRAAVEPQVCEDDRGCLGYKRCIENLCDDPPAITGVSTPSTPWIEFEGPKPTRFNLELAIKDWEQIRGLMYRREMQDDWGMIFIYPTHAPRTFWMKNTLMPLDMVFIDANGVVDSVVEGAEPLTLKGRSSAGAARYVLELKAGWAKKFGIKKGRKVRMGNLDSQHLPRSL